MFTYAVQGSSAALVTEQFVLLIDIPLNEAAQLWGTIAAPHMTLETVLSELIRAGVSNLRDFALVDITPSASGHMATAVRGRAMIQIGGDTHHGQGASTWVEGSAQHGTHMRLTLGEAAGTALTLPIVQGLVQTNELVWGSETPGHLTETVTVHKASTLPEPPLTRPMTALADEHTVVRRAIPKWMLRFTNGKVIGLGDRVVIGRRPAPVLGVGEQLEALLSPRREVSSNQALLVGLEDGVELTDLDSKNGTVVRTRAGASFIIRDGSAYLLREGDIIDFGDGNEAECVRATPSKV